MREIMSAAQDAQTAQGGGIKKTTAWLCVTVSVVFCFGYALVPMYDLFCDLTGINGRTGVASEQQAAALADPVASRVVTVEFDTNLRGGLPWEFRAERFDMQVNTGELSEALFVVRNRSSRPVVGRAIPSVAPAKSGPYFKKTECFCFVEQRLEPGESREMAVRFVVDTGLPQQVSTMTLSYSFFEVLTPEETAAVLLPPNRRAWFADHFPATTVFRIRDVSGQALAPVFLNI